MQAAKDILAEMREEEVPLATGPGAGASSTLDSKQVGIWGYFKGAWGLM